MKLKPNPLLLQLTNKFLEDFFELHSKIEERKRPKNDSFAFNYDLMSAISNSDYANKLNIDDFENIVPSTVNNLLEGLLSVMLKDIPEKILYIIDNFDYQLHDDNEFTNLKIKYENTSFEMNGKKTVIKNENFSFQVKSQNVNFKCNVIVSDKNIFECLILSDKKGDFHKLEMGLSLTNKKDFSQGITHSLYFPEKFWLSRVKDINEFYSVLNCVYRDIKEAVEEEENEKSNS